MEPSDNPDPKRQVEEIWHYYLTTGDMPKGLGGPWFMARSFRPFIKRLPSNPRCTLCDLPFSGMGGLLTRSLGVKISSLNPHICNFCEDALRHFNCGVEVEVSLLFADVRGSTTIAEKLSPAEFSRQIDRFYTAVSKVIYWKNGLVEKLIGDEVAAFFVPGFAGADHAKVAVQAGEEILRATGHSDRNGPWIPVGVGVHTGLAYVGAVGASDTKPDITILGDSVNTAARIASQAKAGELLVSQAAHAATGLPQAGLEARHLLLKGRTEPVDVWVRTVA